MFKLDRALHFVVEDVYALRDIKMMVREVSRVGLNRSYRSSFS